MTGFILASLSIIKGSEPKAQGGGRFDPTVIHTDLKKSLQASKPEDRLWGTWFPEQERMRQRISLFLFV